VRKSEGRGCATIITCGGADERGGKTFEPLAQAISQDFSGRVAILDGEIVYPGPDGRPLFRNAATASIASAERQLTLLDMLAISASSCALPRGERSVNRRFDPSGYVVPAPFTYGDSARNLLFGPGQIAFDVSVLEDTAITSVSAPSSAPNSSICRTMPISRIRHPTSPRLPAWKRLPLRMIRG
jgi:hypothetical protein